MDNYIGRKVGRLTVVGIENPEETRLTKIRFRCECECGNVVFHDKYQLFGTNPIQSCGCLQREAASRIGKKTVRALVERQEQNRMTPEIKRLHRIWTQMRQRCENPNNHAYEYYGGRGIKVCNEWQKVEPFEEWALANGYTKDLTIDRIDTNGGYSPDNCRWANMLVQGNKTRKNKMITYQGRTQSLADWCRQLNCDYNRIKQRINACGYTPEQAFELDKYPAQRLNGNKHLGTLNPA